MNISPCNNAMQNKVIIISNNPRVAKKLKAFEQNACDSYEQVLFQVRNKVHEGARLLTHPLAGSVKPGESPYRSVAITDETGELDMRSLELIESAIDRFRTMTSNKIERQYPAETLEDFQLIDYNLLLTGLESILSQYPGALQK
ncbi:GrdX family protein [Endozoicomonas sp. Mp262]|uniref:GrdX family protein n=1 Tax=Endozoicomonas sp. Mp262 TaxID=2919499 RepID=UPI0021D812B1